MPSRRLGQAGALAQELAKLAEHPSWAVLKAHVDELKQKDAERLARKLMAGGEAAQPVDQRSIDYQRGFWRGVDSVFSSPEDAEKALKRAIERMESA